MDVADLTEVIVAYRTSAACTAAGFDFKGYFVIQLQSLMQDMADSSGLEPASLNAIWNAAAPHIAGDIAGDCSEMFERIGSKFPQTLEDVASPM